MGERKIHPRRRALGVGRVAHALRAAAAVVAGDVCGAWSPQGYVRWKQCFAANMDHPKLPNPDPAAARAINFATLRALWPALTGGDEHDARRDE